jgi:hypothetical protein
MMHKKLFIPGPVEVNADVLKALASPMIGHRMKEYGELHGRVTTALKKLLFTNDKVFLATSSAFGVMEGAVRNLVGKRCANFCNGAFSDKWHDVTLRCGKEADAIRFDWGAPVTPEAVEKALATGKYDSMTMIHNETSTGVMSPLPESCLEPYRTGSAVKRGWPWFFWYRQLPISWWASIAARQELSSRSYFSVWLFLQFRQLWRRLWVIILAFQVLPTPLS